MKCTKYIYATLLCVVMLSGLRAVSFEEYPIGCYSYILNTDHADPYDDAEKNTLCKMLQDMGYNLVHIQNEKDTGLDKLLTKLNNYNFKVLLDDRYYTFPDHPVENYNHYSINAITTSSYLKFEAEYTGAADIDGGSIDENWYCSGDNRKAKVKRVGSAVPNGAGYAWKCDSKKDKPGFAYTDILWRWPNDGVYKRLSYEFRIYNDHNDKLNSNRYVYLKYRIKLDNIPASLPENTPLFSLQTVGFKGDSSTAKQTTVAHYFDGYNAQLHDWKTDYCYGDYLRNHTDDGYYDIEVKVSYAELLDKACGLLTSASFWNYQLVNLNPRVFWNGKCDLSIDYIEMEDQVHHDMMDPVNNYRVNINKRLEYLTGLPNGKIIKYMYAFDEPFAGQFTTFNQVQSFITRYNPKLITGFYDMDDRQIKMPNKGKPRYYDHVKAFLDVAKPDIPTPDIYPVRNETDFNNTKSDFFIQKMFDQKLVKQYKNTRLYCRETTPERPFIPIVQAFGTWEDASAEWGYHILPPYETQKCMQYMPLCFGASGIINYRAINSQTIISGHTTWQGDYTAILAHNGEIQSDPTITRTAITEANAKVSVYGPMIKAMKWVDASMLQVGKKPTGLLSKTRITDLGLKNLTIDNAKDGKYKGYIQCGFYQNVSEQDSPYFMLVNRRANSFQPGNGISGANKVPPNAYKERFPAFLPQSVSFALNTTAHDKYGTWLELYDPFDKKSYSANGETITISIPAGEAKLLGFVATLPSSVTGSATTCYIKQKGFISQDVVIESGANVIFDFASNVTLSPNTKIVVKAGATLTVRNNLNLGDGAQILNSGTLTLDKKKCIMGKDAKILDLK